MKITLTRGISGAGKSTWAASRATEGVFVVSRDEIRARFFNLNEYFETGQDEDFENYISIIEKNEIAAHICRGHDLVIDNTNLEPRYIQRYIDIFAELRVPLDSVEIQDFPCTPDVSIKRNQKAGKNVDHDLIHHQNKLYQKPVKIEDFMKEGRWQKCDILSGNCY